MNKITKLGYVTARMQKHAAGLMSFGNQNPFGSSGSMYDNMAMPNYSNFSPKPPMPKAAPMAGGGTPSPSGGFGIGDAINGYNLASSGKQLMSGAARARPAPGLSGGLTGMLTKAKVAPGAAGLAFALPVNAAIEGATVYGTGNAPKYDELEQIRSQYSAPAYGQSSWDNIKRVGGGLWWGFNNPISAGRLIANDISQGQANRNARVQQPPTAKPIAQMPQKPVQSMPGKASIPGAM